MPIDKFDDEEGRAEAQLNREEGEAFLLALPALKLPDAEEWFLTETDGRVHLAAALVGILVDEEWVPSCHLRLTLREDSEGWYAEDSEVTVYPHEMFASATHSPSSWTREARSRLREIISDAIRI